MSEENADAQPEQPQVPVEEVRLDQVELPESFGEPLLSSLPLPVNLVRQAEQRLEVACSTWANTRGEDVDFAIGLSMVSNQQGNLVAVLGVIISIKAMVLDQRIHASTIIENLWGDQTLYDDMVRSTVQQLIAARTAQGQGVGSPLN